jgi:hypothetical protein
MLSGLNQINLKTPKLPPMGPTPSFAAAPTGRRGRVDHRGQTDRLHGGGNYANPGITVGPVYDELQRQNAMMQQSQAIPGGQSNDILSLLGRGYRAQGGTMLDSLMSAGNAQQRLQSGMAADRGGGQLMDMFAQLYGLNSQVNQQNRAFPIQWMGNAMGAV